MNDKRSPLKIKYLKDGYLEIVIENLESKHIGKKVTLEFYRCVDVLVDRGNDSKKKIYSAKFTANRSSKILRKKIKVESYHGKKIKVYHKALLTIDDSLIFDTKYEQVVSKQSFRDHNVSRKISKGIIEPNDKYNIIKNLKSLSLKNQLLILSVSGTCLTLGILNLLIGCHDQLSPEVGTWLYSHHNGSGESTSPIVDSIYVTIAMVLAAWGYVKYILKRYMTFRAKVKLNKISADTKIMARDLIGGVSKVELRDIQVRVVAGNIEYGSYEVGSGSSQRTVWFKNAINSVVLYKERVMYIPAKTQISNYLEGEVLFKELFQILHPELMTSDTGIKTYWEIQLIHRDFVDQEIPMNETRFSAKDFKKLG